MKTFLFISVHNESANTYSSKDFNGYATFTSRKGALNFIHQHRFEVQQFREDDELKIRLYYLKSMAFNRRRSEIEGLFTPGRPVEVDKYWEKQERLKYAKRKADGFVECKAPDEMTAEDYFGNLKNSLTAKIKEYLSGKPTFGYLGHSWRQLTHDTILEEVFSNVSVFFEKQEIDKWHLLSVWLTSSDARHFMDSQEDFDFEEFREAVIKNIPFMMLRAFVYDLEDHSGRLKDTIQLMDDFSDKLEVEFNGTKVR